MTVTLNEAALTALLNSETGPVGQDIRRRGEAVEKFARFNASGWFIGIRTGNLLEGREDGLGGIQTRVEKIGEEVAAVIFTPAQDNGFYYPAYHDQTGRPWLTEALAAGFDEV